MDHVSLREMKTQLDKYLDPEAQLRVLDAGSADAQNGQYPNYRSLMSPNWEYVGLDIYPGLNVDIVVEPHDYGIEAEFDAVISGQMVEHCEYPWVVFEQITKALKPGGIHINIMPSAGQFHCPPDRWRYFPGAAEALCKWAGLEVLEIHWRTDSEWKNTVLIARKPLRSEDD